MIRRAEKFSRWRALPLENSWLRSCLKLNEKQTFQPFFLSQIAAWKTYAIAKR
jgi:hypothetical protein